MASSAKQADLALHGIRAATINRNLPPASLIEAAVRREEGRLTADGSFVAITKPHTGRSPDDKFVVREATTEKQIWWESNAPFSPEQYDTLKAEVVAYLSSRDELFVTDLYCGADPKHRLNVRAISPNAWQSLFVHNMFIRPTADQLKDSCGTFSLSLATGTTTRSPTTIGCW